MRVFVTGGTGLVGSRLVRRLLDRHDETVVLTRRPAAARDRLGTMCEVVEGDPVHQGPWMDALARCDAVVHLAGENIFARRWNAEFKSALRDSRVLSTENIVRAIRNSPQTEGAAKVLVNASAIGFYGPRGDEELTEDSPPGDDTLARLCVVWENAARAVEACGARLVMVRIGVVLDQEGGALKQMLPPFKWFIGGPAGSGRQYISWIHHADLTGLLLLALDAPAARGPLNGTAPNPVSNRKFSKALGRALHRPSFMRTPRLMLRAMLGEVADVIATGQRVLPRKALELGFRFQFPEIDQALKAVLAH